LVAQILTLHIPLPHRFSTTQESMSKTALILACMSCCGHALRAQILAGRVRNTTAAGNHESPEAHKSINRSTSFAMKPLASLLLAHIPAAAFCTQYCTGKGLGNTHPESCGGPGPRPSWARNRPVQLNAIAVIGGGASGIFSAISTAEHLQANGGADTEVVVFEALGKTLTKVAISGGGRCNVMHDTSKPVETILNGYPRGKKELTGLLQRRFPPEEAKAWFTSRGVELKTEPDGRMFPVTDSSSTVINTLMEAAQRAGVKIRLRSKVLDVVREGTQFRVQLEDKQDKSLVEETFEALILATGSSPFGYNLATKLGHNLVPQVPSLFTLSTKHDIAEGGLLHDLAGLSVPHATVSFRSPQSSQKKSKLPTQEGPLLITHHGVSGPAALRLSAFEARNFHEANYRGDLTVHWAPSLGNIEEINKKLFRVTSIYPKKQITTFCPLLLRDGSTALPQRLWSAMVLSSGFTSESVWGEANKKSFRQLASKISECHLEMTGKGTFKEEFVTAGGVSLKEIDMRSMGSKCAPGLFLCGEVIDVDGVTGGYNFLNCWGTGYIAGESAAAYIQEQPMEHVPEGINEKLKGANSLRIRKNLSIKEKREEDPAHI